MEKTNFDILRFVLKIWRIEIDIFIVFVKEMRYSIHIYINLRVCVFVLVIGIKQLRLRLNL